jgi:catechol 2,3-dioxygenase-like lactoylglutathione lyase family enzyme
MLVKGIDHFTINVVDIEKSINFYENILQMKKLNFVDMGDHGLTYFYLTESCRLELIEYYNDDDAKTVAENTKGTYRHMALLTDDIKTLRQICSEYNIKVKLEPTDMEKLGCRGMLIEDPNGVEIEIVQKY